jgi:hypothetical protein
MEAPLTQHENSNHESFSTVCELGGSPPFSKGLRLEAGEAPQTFFDSPSSEEPSCARRRCQTITDETRSNPSTRTLITYGPQLHTVATAGRAE